MNAKKYLYTSVQNFVKDLKRTDDNILKYRDLFVLKETIDIAIKTLKKDNSSTKEIYQADIIFKSFVMPKIEVICSICSHKMLLELSEQDVINWFFNNQVPLSTPYK